MWKCTYIETSAKNNFNIEAVFQEILTLEQKRQLSFEVDDVKVKFFHIHWMNCQLKHFFSGQEKRDHLFDSVN